MTNDVDHFFMCLVAIFMSSMEKCLFKSFGQFLEPHSQLSPLEEASAVHLLLYRLAHYIT